jgi:hypothetical protein
VGGGGAGAVWEPLEYDCPHEFVVPKDDIFFGNGSATIKKYIKERLKYGAGLFNNVSHVCKFEYVTISLHHPSLNTQLKHLAITGEKYKQIDVDQPHHRFQTYSM